LPDFTTQVWSDERVYMVEFGRAKTGPPHMKFPDLDNIGFQDDAYASEHGPIISSMAGLSDIRVKLFRTEISTSAELHIVSANPTVAKVTLPKDGKLSAAREQIIKFSAGLSGRTALEVRYKWADGPVIGRLYVQVYPRRNVPIRLHLVTVNGAGNPDNFFGASCPTLARKQARLRWFIQQVNHTWIPHGIYLQPEATIYQSAWAAAQIGSASVSPTYNEMVMGGALSPNRSPASLNVYVMGQWTAGTMMALGIPVRWARQQNLLYPAAPGVGVVQHLSNAVYLRSSAFVEPVIVAHEFGHYMELCSLAANGSVQQWHSTGDTVGGAPGSRDDLVSRRRVMYPIVALMPPSFPWRNDVGYGVGKTGGFLTHRQLIQDITMQESTRARSATAGGSFFAV
jgi:hypothetical protein